MKILNRYPFASTEETVYLPDGGRHLAQAYQIVVWISLEVRGQLRGPVPAFLDSGHNHNFSISEEHLQKWLNVSSESLGVAGRVLFRGQPILAREVDVFLHHNQPGTKTIIRETPFRLNTAKDRGILVHPSPIAGLPILGVRSLVRNRLKLIVNGNDHQVTLTKPWLIR